jgi:16S rRNA (guanine527-N7)-methyltransferase
VERGRPPRAARPRAARNQGKRRPTRARAKAKPSEVQRVQPSQATAGGIAAARARLLAGFAELGLAAPPEQVEALLSLARLLERWGRRSNLSGHRDLDSIVRRLILDAAALAVHLPPIASLVDLGSGAGFPGLTLAVLRPGCALLLVEAREKRHHFQRAAVRELGLANVEVVCGRAERIEIRPRAAVIAQAMAQPGKALRWMAPWAEIGGWLALPGGERPPEIAVSPWLLPDRVVAYQVPCGGPKRTLWLARRVL